jgi:hypothetical protein
MSSIHIGSWADLGYRKVGPLLGGALTPDQVADRLISLGDYEPAPERRWVRRRGRHRDSRLPGGIRIAATLDRDTALDDDCLAFMDKAKSIWSEAEEYTPRLRAEPDVLLAAVADADTCEARWRAMYRLAQALFYAGPDRVRPMFREHVAPCFFRLYPEGRIVALRYDDADAGSSALRSMYALAQGPPSELTKPGFRGVRTLHNWHFASLLHLTPLLWNFFNYLFYPFVGGACSCLPGLDFLFLLDPPPAHAQVPFPASWLAVPGRTASYAREEINTVDVLTEFGGPAHRRASHERHQHAQGFGAADRLKLLDWYVGRVNRLLYELVDVANFTERGDPEAPIDPVFGFEHLLTVDRILRETLLAMSLDEAGRAKLMVFGIADLYDALGERFNARRGTSLFRHLFHTQDGPALLTPRLAGLPAPFGSYLMDLTRSVYGQVEDAVVKSVWLPGLVAPGGVRVQKEDQSGDEVIPRPDFVSGVMRAYRNAHHGYFTAGDKHRRPTRFLFPVDGNLPVEISALPVLWWLAYLADPQLVGWRHLEIGAYD